MVAPKGSGTSLRRNFLSGEGINASFAVFQDASGKATERTLALGVGIGAVTSSPHLRERSLQRFSSERGVLMGALAGIMEAQYDTCANTAQPQ